MKKLLLLTTIVLGAIVVNAQDKLVELEQRQGYYIVCPGQTPTFEYEYVGTIKPGAVVKSYKYGDMLNTMLKRISKNDIKGDVLIFTDDNMQKVDVVKFKNKPSNVTAKIDQNQGKWIVYPNQRMKFENDFVKHIKGPGVIKSYQLI